MMPFHVSAARAHTTIFHTSDKYVMHSGKKLGKKLSTCKASDSYRSIESLFREGLKNAKLARAYPSKVEAQF
ncbi:MAG: hypothetical protein ACRECH_08505, partial [Nitrososphaerales archaeon]